MVETYQVSGSPSNSLISHSSWLFRPPLRPHRLEAQEARMGNSSPNPHPHSTPLTHSRQVQLCAKPNHYFWPKHAFVWCSQRFDRRNNQKLHTAHNTELAHHTTHRTTPAHDPHQSARRRASHVSELCCTTSYATLRSGRRR